MANSLNAIAVIPARLGSTRLARKVLRSIAGKPMLAHVYEAAKQSPLLRDVIIATDSDEVLAVARTHGWKAEMIPADVYVNIQGDEPLARPEHLEALLRPMRHEHVMVSTIKTPCPVHDVDNPNAVKVVTDQNGRALYFSRSTIPFDRDRAGGIQYFKHLGFYAYRKPALDRFCSLPESKLELAERLEQLRFLDHGMDIFVEETPFNTVGVDTEEDLLGVEQILKSSA